MHTKYNLKEMVSNNKKVKFTHYKHEKLWYITECGFRFSVPIVDAGDGTFYAEDKALLFMRYIRKELESYQQEIDSLTGEKYWRTGVEYTNGNR